MRKLLLVALAAAAITLFSCLGFWQLGRARWKDAYLASHAAALAAPPVPLDVALGEGDGPTRVQRVTGRGRYDAAATVLLDNRVQDGRVGVMVLTLFRPSGGSRSVLVNRGFVTMGPNRIVPSPAPAPVEQGQISGLLLPPTAPGFKLGNADYTRGAPPPLLAYLDIEALRRTMDPRLFEGVLQLDAGAPAGFSREWVALPNTLPPERHRGYAVQWFGLAFATLVLALVLGLRRRK